MCVFCRLSAILFVKNNIFVRLHVIFRVFSISLALHLVTYLLKCCDFSEKESGERRNHPDHHPHHRAGQDRQEPGGRLCHKPGCC